jgi:PBP1b-binding outer membrane lipoprotein LpoB
MLMESMMKAIYLAMTLTAIAAAGCSKAAKDEPAAGDQGMVMDSGAMKGMAGMGKTSMMPMMQAHMDSMMRMGPEQMSRTMGRHERMMSEMMDQMGGEMRQMKMSETEEWSALTDSLRRDLAELPSLKGQNLQTRMRAHGERVKRLMTAHEQMMKGMR